MEVTPVGTSAASERLDRVIDSGRASPLALGLSRRGLGPYRGYSEMLMAVRELVRRGAALDVIGESVDGEPLFAVTVGDCSARRTSVTLSGVHPSEWIGIETHLALLDRLVDRPPSDRRIVSVVLANPDGIKQVERNLRVTRRRFVRHNRHGVDLNRNFPSYWGRFSLSRLVLRSVFASGRGPASEPEVRAITSFFKGSMIDRAVSFHSFGGVVLYPYGALLRQPIDAAEHRRWADSIARRADPARPYRAVQSSHWVPGVTASGMELDWFHDQHGALSLLVECSRGGLGLSLRRVLEPFAWFNPPRPDTCAPNIATAVEPFVRGLVRPSD
jgi:Zinc carboxypeptidase